MSTSTTSTHGSTAAGADGPSDASRPEGQAGASAGDWRRTVRGSGRNQLLVLLLTVALVAAGAWALGRRTPSSEGGAAAMGNAQAVQVTGPQEGPAPEIGKVPQDFTAPTVTGERVHLAALKGHPVWLTFGASWCTACRAEAPDIEAAYQAGRAKGLEVVSVGMQESRDDIVAYVGRVGLTYPQVADPETALAARYRVMGLPSHFFIDRDGVLRSTHVGAMTRAAMDAELAKITG